ncbi:MAG: helix-turn-helix domain-containing protein, partial [Microcella sp.]
MSMSTEMPRDTRKTQTYLPDASSHDALLDFAEVIRQFEEAEMAGGKAAAALVDPQGNQRTIPVEIFRILDQVANALAAGQGITIIPQGVLMTTQQAADFLGVSRPTVVRLLESGEIDFEKPGHHRRVRIDRLLDF